MTFERARAVADAVLLEGYVLYPYRPTSAKNQYRWTFGVLAPRAFCDGGGSEASWLEAQVLVLSAAPKVRVRLRFLRVVRRTVEVNGRAVERLETDGSVVMPWEEGRLVELDAEFGGATATAFHLPATLEKETVRGRSGAVAGVVHRRCHPLSILLQASIDALSPDVSRVTVRVQNETAFAPGVPRSEAMQASLVSTHLLLASEDGEFASLRDPPEIAAPFVAATKSTGTYPVLAGGPGRGSVVLSSPIILEEPPRVAPESPGDFFDSGEIDELLAIRTKMLTPEEKALARATDPRTRALVDRIDALDDESLARLHGTFRDGPPSVVHRPGERVRLRPGRSGRRTDAQDLLYDGRIALVEAILDDVDGRRYLAVTVEDDPAADLHRSRGLFHHYHPDEVEPLSADEEGS